MSKVAKRRLCPAVAREISSAECGENRGSRYACPAECSFSPFAPANYSQLLELEEIVDGEALAWLARDTADRAALDREVQRAIGAKSHQALHALLVWRIHFARDAAGLTCAQRWERAGFPGLKNDQRVLARAKMSMKIALVEIRRVLDHERVVVVDLLDAQPKPFLVFDRGLASSAARFASGLTWTYALPHFHRLFGSATLLQGVESFEPLEVIEEIVRHLGGPADEAGMRSWLAEHFMRCDAALHAVAVERRRLMFANLGQSMAEKDGKVDLSLVPPRLLEHAPVIRLSSSRVLAPVGNKTKEELEKELFAEQDRRFLDDSIPALDGRTPREAARDPALRPRLIRLMKSRVRMADERNRDTGSNDDVNWMLRELGLDEIIFDPPPAGRVPRTLITPGEDDLDEGDLAEDIESEFAALPMDPELPPAPPLPNRPFTFDEVNRRMRAAFEPFEMAADALRQMETDGCTLIDDVDEVTVDLVDDDSFPLLIPLLANIWFTFAPLGTRGPNLTRADLRDAIQRESLSLLDALKSKTPAALDRYIGSGPQPNLSKAIMGLVLSSAEVMPKTQRPSPEMQGVLSAVLRAVIAELDRAHREWQGR